MIAIRHSLSQGAGVALSKGGVRGESASQGSDQSMSLAALQARRAAPAFPFGVH